MNFFGIFVISYFENSSFWIKDTCTNEKRRWNDVLINMARGEVQTNAYWNIMSLLLTRAEQDLIMKINCSVGLHAALK